MTSWKFRLPGISRPVILPSFILFFFFGNMNVVPGDYQIVNNSNFSERVDKGLDKMSSNPRICPVNSQF